jgi:hypothetical protein
VFTKLDFSNKILKDIAAIVQIGYYAWASRASAAGTITDKGEDPNNVNASGKTDEREFGLKPTTR